MKILALDMATKTGWAILQDGHWFESGVQDFTKGRGESNGLMFLRFRNWIGKMMQDFGPFDLLAYEKAHFRGGAATEICVGLQTHAQGVAAEVQIECAPVATMTLKKLSCGTGKADKPMMVVAASKLMSRPPIDDNEADAVLVGKWAWDQYGASGSGD